MYVASSKDFSNFDSLYFLMNVFVFNCPAAVAECVLITIVKRTALFQIFLLLLLFVLNNTKFNSFFFHVTWKGDMFMLGMCCQHFNTFSNLKAESHVSKAPKKPLESYACLICSGTGPFG